MNRQNFIGEKKRHTRVNRPSPELPSSLQAVPGTRLGIKTPRPLAEFQVRVVALLGHLAGEGARASDDRAFGARARRGVVWVFNHAGELR